MHKDAPLLPTILLPALLQLKSGLAQLFRKLISFTEIMLTELERMLPGGGGRQLQVQLKEQKKTMLFFISFVTTYLWENNFLP